MMYDNIKKLTKPKLIVQNISKNFGGIEALKNINLDILPGEIHALVGENGAGKSTLVKIITGLETPDTGRIIFDGNEVNYRNPMEARFHGIVAVYQDPKLFPNLDVAENIFMGIHPRKKLGIIDRKYMYDKTKELLLSLGTDIDPKTLVVSLSIGQMQFIEFARALFEGNEKILLLDEPTASLTPKETNKLFEIVNKLKDKGISILFISHRLEELFDFVDRITILRDGKCVITENINNLSKDVIVRYMVGKSLSELYGDKISEQKTCGKIEKKMLSVKKLTVEGEFYNVSFDLHAGEILGMFGIVGSGRTEIAKAIFGAIPISSGSIILNGKIFTNYTPSQIIKEGIVYIPEDREKEGLIAELPVIQNMTLPSLKKIKKIGFLNLKEENKIFSQYTNKFQIKTSGPNTKTSSLSGGNRQKVVLSKWIETKPNIFIFDEPTHGIDVSSKAQVHNIIKDLASQGKGVIIISSDLQEILTICDRILVVANGRIVNEYKKEAVTEEIIMSAAIGGKK